MRGGRRVWFVVLPILICVVLAAQAAAQERRVALVIGNGAYRAVPPLTNPDNDARVMARALHDAGFALVGNGPVLDADKARFDAALLAFGRQVAGADVALFYYAGHGMQVQGTNWLVPVNANPTRPQDLDFQMVDAGLVLRQMQGAGTKLNVMILDACRNNPFGGRGLRGAESGLAQMRAPEGTLIAYATEPGSVAADGVGSNSPYTSALADTMRRPGLDVLRMFNQAALAVKRNTGGQQIPWLSSSPIDGEFAFTTAAAGTLPPQPSPFTAQPSPFTAPASPFTPPPGVIAQPEPAPAAPPLAPATFATPEPNRSPLTRPTRCTFRRPENFNMFSGSEASMVTSNEGAPCEIPYRQQQGPFDSGSVVDAPQHGAVQISQGEAETIVAFRPTPGYIGTDEFGVRLRPGNAYHKITVTIVPARGRQTPAGEFSSGEPVAPPVVTAAASVPLPTAPPAAVPQAAPAGPVWSCMTTGGAFDPINGSAFKMTVSNDTASCEKRYARLHLNENQEQVRLPFESGSVEEAPRHGSVQIAVEQAATAVIYHPKSGYVGPDQFAVRLLPGNGLHRMEVTVVSSAPVKEAAAAVPVVTPLPAAPAPAPVAPAAPPPATPVVAAAPAPAAPAPTGQARNCVTTGGAFDPVNGSAFKMTVSNDGGWCDKRYARIRGGDKEKVPVPFDSGSVATPPGHGSVEIANENAATAVIYRPTPGYVGTDQFAVHLKPGNGLHKIEVTVEP